MRASQAEYARRFREKNPEYAVNYRKQHPVRLWKKLHPEQAKEHNRKHERLNPEFVAYRNAKQRCTNPKHPGWTNYGGRGIQFLFTSLEQFRAELGPRPEGKDARGRALYSLDRFPDNDGHYEPGNVRWATMKEQRANQRRKSNGYV